MKIKDAGDGTCADLRDDPALRGSPDFPAGGFGTGTSLILIESKINEPRKLQVDVGVTSPDQNDEPPAVIRMTCSFDDRISFGPEYIVTTR